MKRVTKSANRSVSALLCPHATEVELRKLETFRLAYEHEHGPTQRSGHFTSQDPYYRQRIMMKESPLKYFNGLPQYVQAFVQQQFEESKASGRLHQEYDAFIAHTLERIFNHDRVTDGRVS